MGSEAVFQLIGGRFVLPVAAGASEAPLIHNNLTGSALGVREGQNREQYDAI